jgi:GNAT superfamily N-acetyltransferase
VPLDFSIHDLSTEAEMAEYARAMAHAFEKYPVIQRAFGQAGGHPLTWAERMVRGSASVRLQVGMRLPVVKVQGRVVGGASLIFPDTQIPDELRNWWPAFIEEAGPECADFFERFLSAVDRIPVPQPNLWLAMLGIEPEFQGIGLGRAMLEHTVEIARSLPGVIGVGLDTELESNVALYERCGFEVLGESRVDDMPIWVLFRATN